MSSKLYTFINIFDSDIEFEDDEKILCVCKKIIIPIIQRDYVQGRNNFSINRVRKNFLDALYKAVTEKPMILDFIYGDIDEDGILTPLDGQQRLTTLFLLHWYAAKKENISPNETKFLENFSYATRPDSREFCNKLINFQPTFCEENLSDEIEDQPAFPLGWKKDPTVSAMLNMLDDINKKFFEVENLWEKLKSGAISFYFLPIKKMGLTDEIYITMNSRGKPLTNFEHFKAEFKSRLDLIDSKYSTDIICKTDTVWTDLLWQYRDKKNLIDSGFLNYFRFICNVLLYKSGGTTQGKNRIDIFILLNEFFCGDNVKILSNVQFLEKSLDCWKKIQNIDEFFSDRISCGSKKEKNLNKHEPKKFIIYHSEKNLFKNCLETYDENFSLGRFVLLYAFLVYLFNFDDIPDDNFRRRVRIVNNLVMNSEGELSDSETRQGGNRMPTILRQVESIIKDGRILSGIGPNFNDYQLKEEREKLIWTEKNLDKADLLFALEDHYLLYGQIGIIGLEYPEYFMRFISLFKCDYDKVSCVLLINGDYLQEENSWRYQLGSVNSESWQNLFHRSLLVKRYDYTQAALSTLFEEIADFSDKILDEIIEEYISNCEKKLSFDWIYYYVKYDEFRPKKHGKYFWQDFENKPYEFLVMLTRERISANAYQPFLKAAVSEEFFDKYYSRDFENPCFVFEKLYVTCENDAIVVKNFDNTVKRKIEIQQHKKIDIEDRIKKLKTYLKKSF